MLSSVRVRDCGCVVLCFGADSRGLYGFDVIFGVDLGLWAIGWNNVWFVDPCLLPIVTPLAPEFPLLLGISIPWITLLAM